MSGFNHVGIGVADIHRGVAFYTDVFGCAVLRQPFEVRADGARGDHPVDVLKPPPFKRMFVAHLVADNGVGIELFQLIDPPHEQRFPILEYWKSGVFHFAMTAGNIEAQLSRLVGAGGTQLSMVWVEYPDDETKLMVYCADPWGTIIELYSYPYGEMHGRR